MVTKDELRRITEFTDLNGISIGQLSLNNTSEIKAGDFDSLVNLETLSIWGDIDLPSGTLDGLAVHTLKLNVAALTPGTFDGMTGVKELYIQTDQEDLPAFDSPGLTDLETLNIEFKGRAPDLEDNALEHLVNLVKLRFSGNLYSSGHYPQDVSDPIRRQYHLPRNLLTHNLKLQSVSIHLEGHDISPTPIHPIILGHVVLPHSLLAHLTELERICVGRTARVPGHKPGNPPADLAPGSPIGENLEAPVPFPKEWQLHDRGYDHYHELVKWHKWENGDGYCTP